HGLAARPVPRLGLVGTLRVGTGPQAPAAYGATLVRRVSLLSYKEDICIHGMTWIWAMAYRRLFRSLSKCPWVQRISTSSIRPPGSFALIVCSSAPCIT